MKNWRSLSPNRRPRALFGPGAQTRAGTNQVGKRQAFALSTVAAGFYDYVAVRQTGLHAHDAALGVVVTPPVVMTLIDMLANDRVITIVHDNLRRYRTGADKHCPDCRS
jgi:hypothetical protein